MGEKQQKGKGNKRSKGWHRGRAEGRRSRRRLRSLPDVGSGADPADGGPMPIKRGPGNSYRGDTA